MAGDIWFSDCPDAKQLVSDIAACPELVVVRSGNGQRASSLLSVMDEHRMIRLYAADRKSLVLVQRQGRKVTGRSVRFEPRKRRATIARSASLQ